MLWIAEFTSVVYFQYLEGIIKLMNKKAYRVDRRNKKNEGNVYVVRGTGERQEERKSYEKYYHNQQSRLDATTRPKSLPMRLLCPARREGCRTIADGAQVVASSYHVLLYVTIREVIFVFCHH